MKEHGPTTWIEQRVAELERNLEAWKGEMRSSVAAGTGPDPQVLARMDRWEKELKGLKSLRDIRGDFPEL